MAAQPLTRECLSWRCRRMKPLALGLDGCGVRNLRRLTARLMDWVADMLSLVEALG